MSFGLYRHAILIVICLLLPLLLIGCGGGGSSNGGGAGPYTVTGKITTADGAPVNATVKLYKTSYTIYSIDSMYYSTRNLSGVESITLDAGFVQTSTNEFGVYSFTGVYSGTYTIVPTSDTYVFKWSQVPTMDRIGVATITDSGLVYMYNPEGLGNKLSADSTIIYNVAGTPFSLTNNVLSGQDFEAALPGGSGI